MTKSELIDKIHQLYPFLSSKQSADIVELVFESLSCGLAQGKRVEIRGFGSFVAKTRKVQLKFASKASKLEFGFKRSIYFRIGNELFNRLNILEHA